MNHLLYFTIGPVQSFISQARKTQDLFMGSQLLTNCIGTCLASVDQFNQDKSTGHCAIIFPHRISQQEEKSKLIQSLPNRLLIEFVGVEEKIVKEQLKKLVRIANEFLEKCLDELPSSLGLDQSDPTKNALKSQLRDFFDVQWVVQPYDPKQQPYQDAYQQLLGKMASTKYTRTFVQQQGQLHRKCSLSGEADALVFGDYAYGKHQAIKPSYTNKNADRLGLREPHFISGEGLSAVQFVKRFHKFDQPDDPASRPAVFQAATSKGRQRVFDRHPVQHLILDRSGKRGKGPL
jgi:CRISPR-associated protein Cmr2